MWSKELKVKWLVSKYIFVVMSQILDLSLNLLNLVRGSPFLALSLIPGGHIFSTNLQLNKSKRKDTQFICSYYLFFHPKGWIYILKYTFIQKQIKYIYLFIAKNPLIFINLIIKLLKWVSPEMSNHRFVQIKLSNVSRVEMCLPFFRLYFILYTQYKSSLYSVPPPFPPGPLFLVG